MMMGLLLAVQHSPVDFMAGQNRALTHDEIPIFYAAFHDKRTPHLADVIRTEKMLSRFRCIGPMRRWHRVFSFGRNADTLRLDTSLIAFTFTQAGRYGRRADRRITTLGGAIDGFDDRQFLMANGIYSIRTHLATVTFCGSNWATG